MSARRQHPTHFFEFGAARPVTVAQWQDESTMPSTIKFRARPDRRRQRPRARHYHPALQLPAQTGRTRTTRLECRFSSGRLIKEQAGTKTRNRDGWSGASAALPVGGGPVLELRWAAMVAASGRGNQAGPASGPVTIASGPGLVLSSHWQSRLVTRTRRRTASIGLA